MGHTSAPLAYIKDEYLKFLAKFQSLHLSTIGEGGRPESSYAPFVVDQNNRFYIYISTLAGHTSNLINDGRAGIMLVEPEKGRLKIFSPESV